MGALEIFFIIIIIIIVIAFISLIRTVTFKRGPWEVAVLCNIHNLMPVGFSCFIELYESLNDFLPGCLFAVVI